MDALNKNEELYSYENEGCNWVPEYGAVRLTLRRRDDRGMRSPLTSPPLAVALVFAVDDRGGE